MNNNNVDMFVVLSLMADLLQIANYDMNLKEVTNNKILEELERQNQEYLEIIKKEVIKLKEENNGKTIS
jgi:hypothetical protein